MTADQLRERGVTFNEDGTVDVECLSWMGILRDEVARRRLLWNELRQAVVGTCSLCGDEMAQAGLCALCKVAERPA